MKYTNYIVVLLSAAVVTGCSSLSNSTNEQTLGDRSINYQEGKSETTDLIIPPDLTNPKQLGGFSSNSNNLLDLNASDILQAKSSNVEVKRDSYRRWLVVNKPPSDVWPMAKKFLQSFGFKINKEDQEIGIIETEFLETNQDVPEASIGIFKSMFSGILKAKYALPIADKYRIRIEETDDINTTEVYLSLTSIEEVSTDKSTLWQSRAKDAELETEMLLRLMVFLGSDRSEAINKIQETSESAKSPVLVDETQVGYAALVFPYQPDQAWVYLGWALDELGVEILDSDSFERSYYVNLVKTNDKGIFSKLFSIGGDDISAQLVVRQREEGYSQVIFNNLSEEDEQKAIDFSFAFFKEIAEQF